MLQSPPPLTPISNTYKDILVAMGIVELPIRQFGLEAAGIVLCVGSNVKDLKVGDRVICLKKHAFATRFTVKEFACAKIPDALSFDVAATMLVPYVTALYSLVDVGGLEESQVRGLTSIRTRLRMLTFSDVVCSDS